MDRYTCLTNRKLCGNPTINGMCTDVCKMTDIQAAEALAAEQTKPYCPANDSYCQQLITKFLPGYTLVESSTQDRVCILKDGKNETWTLKLKDDCTSTVSKPCIVSEDACNKIMMASGNAVNEYQYEKFSIDDNLCIVKHKTTQKHYKIVVPKDCTNARLLPL